MKRSISGLLAFVCLVSMVNAKPAKTNADKKTVVEKKIEKTLVQIVIPETENMETSEKSWLPLQVQSKLKSNVQDYLFFRTLVDSASEKKLLQVQKQSAEISHDETEVIEFGKLTNAKFAVFSSIIKTSGGYILNVDYTDLTTGEQLASVISKEYSKAEYLYGTTGAVDEVTLSLAAKLNISLTELQKKTLSNGTAGFTVEEQLKIAQENEKAYKNQLSNYDAEIAKLARSTDLAAVENRKKIEAEKALLLEKQSAEKKRQQELA